jgi:hypothetical protein
MPGKHPVPYVHSNNHKLGMVMPEPASTRASAWFRAHAERLSWAAVATLITLHAVRLARFAVDWPFHDDFTQILAVPGYLAHMPTLPERLAYVFSLSIEHRIATLRIAGWLGSLAPGGLDFRLLILIGNGLAAVAGALLVMLFPSRQRALAALVATLLLTSVTHYGAQYWATGALQHFGVCAYAMVALFAAARGHSLVAAAAALAAAFTAANGLMVVPAAVLLLAMSGRRREAVAWALVGGALFALYFVGYETPAGRMSALEVLREPARLAAFGLATLGSFGDAEAVAIAIGLAIVLCWLGLAVTGGWRRVPPVAIAAMLFFALTCAAVALGRAALGAEAATQSRYRVYSAAAILLTLAAVLRSASARRRVVVVGVAVVVAAVAHVWGGMRSMPYMIELSSLLRASRDHYAATGHGFYPGFPPPEFGDYVLQRARDIGAYDGLRHASAPIVATGGAPSDGGEPLLFSSHVYANGRVLSVVGMMGGRHRAATLWLDDGRAAFRAELGTVRCMGPDWDARRTVFRGTVDVAILPPGSYRVGYDGGAGSGVVWTGQEVHLR